MSRKIINDDSIYCYKCGTKNDINAKKCCNKECKTKLHDKDHLYIDYFIEKWHEFLEDLGKDSVVGAITLFFNYILYGTVLSISVIGIISGVVDSIIDSSNNNTPKIIANYENKYDSNSLIKGCWYSKDHDEYLVVANEQFRLKDEKKTKMDYSFSKIGDNKVLTLKFDEIMTTGKYNWEGKDNLIFYFDNFEAANVSYKRIKCSDIPGEKIEEPIIDVKPEITTTEVTTYSKTTKNINVKESTTSSIKTTTTITKAITQPTTNSKSYIFEGVYDDISSCRGAAKNFVKDTCDKYFGEGVFNPNAYGYNLVNDCSPVTDEEGNTKYYIALRSGIQCDSHSAETSIS